MNKVEIEVPEKQLTESDLDDFENKFDKKLPQNFRQYLLKFNGGLVENRDDLHILLSLLEGNTIEYSIEIHQLLEQNINSEFLPIAYDYSSNPYCLVLEKGDNFGKVVFIEMDGSGEVFPHANSLEEFLGVDSIDDL